MSIKDLIWVPSIEASHSREESACTMGCTHLPHLMSQAVMPPEKPFIVEECGQCFRGIVSIRAALQGFVSDDCLSLLFGIWTVYVSKEADMEVCTACFVASCKEHAYLHYNKTSHQFSVAIRLVDTTQSEVEFQFSFLVILLTSTVLIERELGITGAGGR
jgi:hypothetical protein